MMLLKNISPFKTWLFGKRSGGINLIWYNGEGEAHLNGLVPAEFRENRTPIPA